MARKPVPSKKFKETFEKYKKEFSIESEYTKVDEKLLVKHNCGFEFEITPKQICQSGLSCPQCRCYSKGERLIRKILSFIGEDWTREYTFSDCVDKAKLRFDFAVLSSDGSIKCLIEFHGIQHYAPVKFTSESVMTTRKKFRDQQRRDEIKRDYCLKNNIKLIEIPYSDYFKLDFLVNYCFMSDLKFNSFVDFFKFSQSNVFSCTLPVEIISKSNNVMSNKRGFTYIPQKFKDFETLVRKYAIEKMTKDGFKKTSNPLVFHMTNFHGTKRKKDVTNCFKSICDALNGVLYEDDSQIISCSGIKCYDKFKPRTEMVVISLDEKHPLVNDESEVRVGPKKRRKKQKQK